MKFLTALGNVIVDRTADELIGAVLLAFVLAGAMTGIYALARRKVTDTHMLMIGLMVLANIASMGLATGYLVYSRRQMGAQGGLGGPPRTGRPGIDYRPGLPGLGPSPAAQIIDAADADRDGRLSPDEAEKATTLLRDARRGKVVGRAAPVVEMPGVFLQPPDSPTPRRFRPEAEARPIPKPIPPDR